VKWLKLPVGILLLPFVVAQGWTLWDLAAVWLPAGGWRSGWFLAFGGGLALWLLVYFCLPRPLWIYVFGHELTHAWAVWLSGGKVYDFRVGSAGGHVKADRVNWFIALAPYFIPLYSVMWLLLWVSFHFYLPLDRHLWMLFAGFGITWGFHLTFTVSMIKLGQTDISSQGYFFSAAVILIMNLFLFILFFIAAAGPVTWWSAFQLFGQKIWACYSATALFFWNLAGQAVDLLRTHAAP
jgi:hypothetical protein